MKEQLNLPEHIGIIMDGNGRWAKQRNKSRNEGHKAGVKTLEDISKHANNIGIKYLSIYAFSTENWNRPKKEVDNLMNLLRTYLKRHIKEAEKNNIKVLVIGDKNHLAPDIIKLIDKLEHLTKHKNEMILNLALNYGGRNEIIRAIKKLHIDIENDNMKLKNLNEETFTKYLDTSTSPSPDLIIRTSGEQRLSNFLTWQSAYSEFYFTKCLWPDFTTEEFNKALEDFSNRQRRFGKVK